MNASLKVSTFFDDKKVIAAVERANKQNVVESSKTIKYSAIDSMKRAPYGKSSPAGQPPRDHAGYARELRRKKAKRIGQKLARAIRSERGLKYLFNRWDAANKSAIVGPEKFNDSQKHPTIPQVLEFGGRSRGRKGRAIAIRKRPFMAPALAKELPSLPPRWRGTVRA